MNRRFSPLLSLASRQHRGRMALTTSARKRHGGCFALAHHPSELAGQRNRKRRSAMYVNPFHVSLETLIGAAPLLGHKLEDRSGIRDAQDAALIQKLQAVSSVRLRDASQQDLFCVAPLDVLVTGGYGRKQFHLIEINGTGIGGLTNLPGSAVSGVLDGL